MSDRYIDGLCAGFAVARDHAKLAVEYDRGYPNTRIDWTAVRDELRRIVANGPPMQTFGDVDAAHKIIKATDAHELVRRRTAYAVLTARDERITGVGVFGEPTPTGRIAADCTSVVLFERTGKDYAEAQQAAFEELKNARWSWTGVLTSDGLGRYYRDARGFVLTRLPDPHAEFKATGDEERALATGAEELMRVARKRLEAYKQDTKNASVQHRELELRAVMATILCELEAYVTK